MKKLLIAAALGFVTVKLTKKGLNAFADTKVGDDVLYAFVVGMTTFMNEFDMSQDIRKIDDSWERRQARFEAYEKAHPTKVKEKN